MAVNDPLPPLSHDELETLRSALDPLLDGFGEGGTCLDDASAYLARLGIRADAETGEPGTPVLEWIQRWREAGGNRETLRLMVTTMLSASDGDGGSPEET